jgi:hypothetical protein
MFTTKSEPENLQIPKVLGKAFETVNAENKTRKTSIVFIVVLE